MRTNGSHFKAYPIKPLVGMRIAVIDDSITHRTQLKHLLSNIDNCNVVTFERTDPALVDLIEDEIDLVVVDNFLDPIPGLDFVRQLRLKPGLDKLPVVLLSGESGPETRWQAQLAGATQYHTKPINPTDFRLRIAALLASHAGRDEASRERLLV